MTSPPRRRAASEPATRGLGPVDQPVSFHVYCSTCGKSRDFVASQAVGVSRLAVLTGCPVPDRCELEYLPGALDEYLRRDPAPTEPRR